MRHFTLVNNSGDSLDITTTEILFHDISGLGFDEDNDFRHTGDFWLLNRTSVNQATISGSVIFNEGEEDPYAKYRRFVRFVTDAPLTMLYNPEGPIQSKLLDPDLESDNCFRRRVRVSKLDKTEKNEYGVLDCSIDFVCYTPWYSTFYDAFEYVEDSDDGGAWIWAGTETKTVVDPSTQESSTVTIVHPSLVFEPEAGYIGDCTRARFAWEPALYYEKQLDTDVDSCPIKMTIHGPLHNPSWVHSVVNGGLVTVVSSGGFANGAEVDLASGEKLVIDGTFGNYEMYKITQTGAKQDVYEKRDFSTEGFVKFRKGTNRLAVTSDYGDIAEIVEVEGHSYHATV